MRDDGTPGRPAVPPEAVLEGVPVPQGPPVPGDGGIGGLSDEARARVTGGFAAATRRAYARDWTLFERWCLASGRDPLPAAAATLAEYVTHLAGRVTGTGRPPAPATVERALGCIQSRHRLAGYTADGRLARLALRDYRREHQAGGGRAKAAAPAEIGVLRAMVDTADPATPAGVRDRALLVLGFALMARRSELAGLDLADVRGTAEGVEVTIRRSKTDQDGRGEVVPLPYGAHPDTCPVRTERAWRELLAARGITAGPLFRGVDRHGRVAGEPGAAGRPATRLSGHGVHLIVRRAAERAGLPAPEDYTGHSLRAGGATSAAKAGAPVSVIARHGRWSEKSPVVHGYIRAADKWRDNPMRGVGL